ncbi:MAG: hypothetical protein HQ589_00920 [Syntrophaceae bacterium]|nr:hypothetical protein [Syntrophaceae bacterium]
MGEIEQEIKSYALKKTGILAVGIASVEDINRYAPVGYRPDDQLPGAKSVIVLGGHHPTKASWGAHPKVMVEIGPTADGPLGHAFGLSYFLERSYDTQAVVTIANTSLGGSLQGGTVPWQSMKLHAEMAGLGQRSMMGGVILNPKHGFLALGSCITTLELKLDGPLKKRVCPQNACIKLYEKTGETPCIQACPFKCLSGKLQDGRIKEMGYLRYKCGSISLRDREHSILIHRAVKKALDGNEFDMKQILYGEEFISAENRLAYGQLRYIANCWECVKSCPVVKKGIKK